MVETSTAMAEKEEEDDGVVDKGYDDLMLDMMVSDTLLITEA